MAATICAAAAPGKKISQKLPENIFQKAKLSQRIPLGLQQTMVL